MPAQIPMLIKEVPNPICGKHENFHCPYIGVLGTQLSYCINRNSSEDIILALHVLARLFRLLKLCIANYAFS